MGNDVSTIDLNTVLGKAIALLHSFSVNESELSLAALVERTGLHKTTAHRVAAELVRYRLLDRTAFGYRLSGGLFELGMRASFEPSLLELAMPFLQDLYEHTHQTVHLGVRDQREVVYIAKLAGRHPMPTPSRVGGRMPLHCTAIGKVLLARGNAELRREVLSAHLERRTAHTIVTPGRLHRQLERSLETGVAFEREESALGICCVAAPVLDAHNQPIAAISVTGPVNKFIPERHVDAVRAAAQDLGARLAESLEPYQPNNFLKSVSNF